MWTKKLCWLTPDRQQLSRMYRVCRMSRGSRSRNGRSSWHSPRTSLTSTTSAQRTSRVAASEELKLVPDDEEIKKRVEELRRRVEESAARAEAFFPAKMSSFFIFHAVTLLLATPGRLPPAGGSGMMMASYRPGCPLREGPYPESTVRESPIRKTCPGKPVRESLCAARGTLVPR